MVLFLLALIFENNSFIVSESLCRHLYKYAEIQTIFRFIIALDSWKNSAFSFS